MTPINVLLAALGLFLLIALYTQLRTLVKWRGWGTTAGVHVPPFEIFRVTKGGQVPDVISLQVQFRYTVKGHDYTGFLEETGFSSEAEARNFGENVEAMGIVVIYHPEHPQTCEGFLKRNAGT